MTATSPVLWDFQLALEFSRTFDGEDHTEHESQPTTPVKFPPRLQQCDTPHSLGDFSRIYTFLGIEPPPTKPDENLSTPELDGRPSPPTPSEPAEDFDEFLNRFRVKEVRWDETLGSHDADKQGLHVKRLAVGRSEAEYAKDPEPTTPGLQLVPSSVTVTRSARLPSSTGLSLDTDPAVIRPFEPLTKEQQRARLFRKLRKHFPGTPSLALGASNFESSTLATTHATGIHVFVDFSNIIIGFYNRLKSTRGLHEKAFVKQPPISYQSLALALERGRRVSRRVLVGSTSRNLYSSTGPQKVAKHFSDAERCGYELNILDRVSKIRPATPIRKKRSGTGTGYATATSGDESTAIMELKRPVMAEQGVDELLQMKILESIIDASEPTTIVLASGDAAEAEYSGGFFKTVQRALNKGWKVEVAAWRDGLSREYLNKEFLKQWNTQFQIVELDVFAEEFLAVYL